MNFLKYSKLIGSFMVKFFHKSRPFQLGSQKSVCTIRVSTKSPYQKL